MEACLEKCNDFARSKPARIIWGVVLTLICCVGVYRLLHRSNQMNERRLARLKIIPESDEGSLIYFNSSSDDNLSAWRKKFDEFITPYETPHPNSVKCSYDSPPPPGKVCQVDLEEFGPCSPTNNYGLGHGGACVFFKIRPDPSQEEYPKFNTTYLPKSMPEDLKDYIGINSDKDFVAWISCEPEKSIDAEKIGNIEYHPHRGFSQAKISSDKAWVALQFRNPDHGVVIYIKCKLWTQNAVEKTSFELLID